MIRQANELDNYNIAKLIVSGWQTAYRGLIADDFLDNMSVERMTDGWSKKIKNQFGV